MAARLETVRDLAIALESVSESFGELALALAFSDAEWTDDSVHRALLVLAMAHLALTEVKCQAEKLAGIFHEEITLGEGLVPGQEAANDPHHFVPHER